MRRFARLAAASALLAAGSSGTGCRTCRRSDRRRRGLDRAGGRAEPARSQKPRALSKVQAGRSRGCAFLTVQHRKIAEGSDQFGILLTGGTDRRVSDRAEQRLRRGLRSAGKLAQRA